MSASRLRTKTESKIIIISCLQALEYLWPACGLSCSTLLSNLFFKASFFASVAVKFRRHSEVWFSRSADRTYTRSRNTWTCKVFNDFISQLTTLRRVTEKNLFHHDLTFLLGWCSWPCSLHCSVSTVLRTHPWANREKEPRKAIPGFAFMNKIFLWNFIWVPFLGNMK